MNAQDNECNIPLQKTSSKSTGKTNRISKILKLGKSKSDPSNTRKQNNANLSKTVTIVDPLNKNKIRKSRSLDDKTRDKTCDCQQKSNGLEMETVCDFLGINIELDKIKRRASVVADPNYLLITVLRISLEKVKALNESNTEFCHCLISAKKMKAIQRKVTENAGGTIKVSKFYSLYYEKLITDLKTLENQITSQKYCQKKADKIFKRTIKGILSFYNHSYVYHGSVEDESEKSVKNNRKLFLIFRNSEVKYFLNGLKAANKLNMALPIDSKCKDSEKLNACYSKLMAGSKGRNMLP